MGDVTKLNDIMRPSQVALADAINRAIDELAMDKMTLSEVIGVLDVVKMERFIKQKEREEE